MKIIEGLNYRRIKVLRFLKRKCFINGEYYKAFFTIIVFLVFYNFLLGDLFRFFNIFNLKIFFNFLKQKI